MRWIELAVGFGICIVSLAAFVRWIEPSPDKNHLASSTLRFTAEVFLRLAPFYGGLILIIYAVRQDFG